jgi:hypothetical protein
MQPQQNKLMCNEKFTQVSKERGCHSIEDAGNHTLAMACFRTTKKIFVPSLLKPVHASALTVN